MIVVDASVIVEALVAPDGPEAEALGFQDELAVPAVLGRTEVLDGLRKAALMERIPSSIADELARRLMSLPLAEHAEVSLDRVWELRSNLRPYDATYVALAEQLGVPVLTNDRRLSRAPGPRCDFRLIA